MSLDDGHVEKTNEPIERPFKWSDLWRIFLPLYPWIGIALLIYFIVRLLKQS